MDDRPVRELPEFTQKIHDNKIKIGDHPCHEIRHLFLCKFQDPKYGRYTSNIDIAYITDDLQWHFNSIQSTKDCPYLSFYTLDRVEKLFTECRFSPRTVVTIIGDIDLNDPIRLYLRVIWRYIKFKVIPITLDDMISRISKFRKKILKRDKSWMKHRAPLFRAYHQLEIIFTALCRENAVPWMTYRDYQEIMNMSNYAKLRAITQRVGLYYIMLKIRATAKWHRCSRTSPRRQTA